MLERLEKAVRTVQDFPTPGITFRDITPILADPALLRAAVDALVDPFRHEDVTKVVGIEARGFILGAMIADALGAGFVPVRKKGKLPYTTIQETYALEYGVDTIEMHIDAVTDRDRVLVHDDVIATGGTAAATQRLIELSQGAVVGYAFLVELVELRGRDLLENGVPVHSILQF